MGNTAGGLMPSQVGPSAAVRYSIVIITFRRDDALQENLAELSGLIGARQDTETVLVDNNEDEIDRAVFLGGFANKVYYKPGVNRGVTGGRNDGIEHASGIILVFLDDDASITSPNFLGDIDRIFSADPQLGILAFRSTNFYTRKMDRLEFPHTDKSRDPALPFKTFRYIGVGHAIRREVFDRVGLYEDDFFYAAEEFDMSYRAIKAGYTIRYSPEIGVLHKKHPSGRLPAPQMVERSLLNKMRVGFMHLPGRYRLVNAVLWTVYAIWLSRGRANLFSVWRRYRDWTLAHPERRQPLAGSALAYVRACGAHIWK
jgi:GT2 family glycosyltransferase